jgi:hypothetical protein
VVYLLDELAEVEEVAVVYLLEELAVVYMLEVKMEAEVCVFVAAEVLSSRQAEVCVFVAEVLAGEEQSVLGTLTGIILTDITGKCKHCEKRSLFRYITVHYITLQYITLQYSTLRYSITLQN